MDFTDFFKHTSGLVKFSPSGDFLAAVVDYRVVVRDTSTLEVVRLFTALDPITHVEWSPDSSCILAASYKTGRAIVWSLANPTVSKVKRTDAAKAPSSRTGTTRPATASGATAHKSNGSTIPTRPMTSNAGGTRMPLKPREIELKQTATGKVDPKLEKPWEAKIDEGIAGMVKAMWTPDSLHVMTYSDFEIRVTIWSLSTGDSFYIKYPKYSDRAHTFRSDGRYLAVAERLDCKDFVCIYDCMDWKLAKRFPVETNDLDDISWSPDGRFLAIWEPCLEYKILIYSPDGRLVYSYSAYEEGPLGIKTVQWSPCSRFLAIGSYDERLRFLNAVTWKPLLVKEHPQILKDTTMTVYREVCIDLASDQTNPSLETVTKSSIRPRVKYEFSEPPVQIPQVKPDAEKANPKSGVGLLAFSRCGRWVATRNDNMPNTLWIHDLALPDGNPSTTSAVLIQAGPVKGCVWDPSGRARLAFWIGQGGTTGRLYIWTPEGCESVEVPAVNFSVSGVEFQASGRSMLVFDKERFCLCFPVDDV